MADLEQFMQTAILDFVLASVVPIYKQFKKDGRTLATTFGSGTLFQFEGRHFLVTAAHIADKWEQFGQSVAIPESAKTGKLMTFGEASFLFPKDKVIRDMFDLGLIELKDEHISRMNGEFRFLSYENIELRSLSPQRLVTGFPESMTNFDYVNNQAVSRPLILMVDQLTQEEELTVLPRDVYSFFVHWSSNYRSANPNFTSRPTVQDISGASGGAIWQLTRGQSQLWTPEKNIKISGVQSAALSGQRLRGIKIGYLENIFSKYDDKIHSRLKEIER